MKKTIFLPFVTSAWSPPPRDSLCKDGVTEAVTIGDTRDMLGRKRDFLQMSSLAQSNDPQWETMTFLQLAESILGVLSLNINFHLSSFWKFQIGETGHILVSQPEESDSDMLPGLPNLGTDVGKSVITMLSHQEPGPYLKSEEGKERVFTAAPSHVLKTEKTKWQAFLTHCAILVLDAKIKVCPISLGSVWEGPGARICAPTMHL